jgi:hypothetical protein
LKLLGLLSDDGETGVILERNPDDLTILKGRLCERMSKGALRESGQRQANDSHQVDLITPAT